MRTITWSCMACGLLLSAILGCNVRFLSDGYRFDYRGEQAQRTTSGQISAEIQRIEIDNRYGAVRVEPAVDGDTTWIWDLTCWANTSVQAEESLQQMQMQNSENLDVASWNLVFPEPPAHDLRGIRSNLTLKVPPTVTVTIGNRGDVDLRSLQGDIDINNRHGTVAVRDLSGSCRIANEHGDVTAQSVASARVSIRHGSASVSGVLGDLHIESEHGAVEVREVQGELRVTNEHGNIVANDIKGNAELETEHARMTVNNLSAGATLKNAHGPIRAENIRGDVTVQNRHGSTELNLDSTAVTCRCEHGSIKLVLNNPEIRMARAETSHASIHVIIPDSKYDIVVASADHGRIQSDVPFTTQASNSTTGEPPFAFKTRHGNIRIETSASAR